MTRKLLQLLDLVAGDHQQFPLEHRLLNAISLLNGVAILGGGFLLGLQSQLAMALLHTVTGLLFLLFYYLARFRNMFRGLYWPFVLLVAAFLWINTLFDAGTLGGAHYHLIPAVVIAVMLSGRVATALLAWGFFALVWLSLIAIELWRPDLVVAAAPAQQRLLEVAGQFLFVQLFTAGLFVLLAHNLNHERVTARRLLSNVRSISESANDAIVTADARGRVTSWNPAAAQMFGMAEEEAVGESLTMIIPARYRDAHRNGIRRMNETGEAHVLGQTVELSALRRDGSEFPIELSLSSWKTGEDRFFSGIIRDITQRKEAEAELAAKAEELAAAKQEVEFKNEELQGLASKLAKYLSHQVYRSIFAGEKDVKIESYRKKLTVFFSDVKGFTDLTDSMEPEQLSSLLNSYLDEMARIAARHGGTIDKFIGDAIMIFFGDPETKGEKEDALACAHMALEMREAMLDLQQKWTAEWGIAKPLRIRMGINTGFCTVGNFGSEERLDYTIIGGQVNLASRLESAAETDQILISGETHSLIKDEIACERKGEIRVKGIARPVQTFQIIDTREKLGRRPVRIREDFGGFSLDVDLSRLEGPVRGRAVAALRRALEQVEAAPDPSGAG